MTVNKGKRTLTTTLKFKFWEENGYNILLLIDDSDITTEIIPNNMGTIVSNLKFLSFHLYNIITIAPILERSTR